MDQQTRNTVQIFDTHAKQYAEKYQDVSAYHKGLNRFCDALPQPSPSILELAAGPGNITSAIVEYIPTASMLCTDLSPAMLSIAKSRLTDITTMELDCRDIDKLPETYDGIAMAFGMPYLTKEEVRQFIHDASKKMNDDGVLFLTWIEGLNKRSGETSNAEGTTLLMNYHEVGYVKDFITQHGMSIVLEETFQSPHNTDTESMIVAKKKP